MVGFITHRMKSDITLDTRYKGVTNGKKVLLSLNIIYFDSSYVITYLTVNK